jgi:4a-hydroxytetrahydrobiopterin dehydratase
MVAEWDLTKRDGINCLNRTFEVNDFFQAMAFAFKIGKEAENEGHHPQITFEWGRVHVAWWTHKIKGLHRNDFIMAAKTDEIFTNLQQSNFL